MKKFASAVARMWKAEGGKKAMAKYFGGSAMFLAGLCLMLSGSTDLDAAAISDYLAHDLDEDQRNKFIEAFSDPEYGKR